MAMRKIYFIFYIFILLFVNDGFCSETDNYLPGYIITDQGTSEGLILDEEQPISSTHCVFKLLPDSEAQVYLPGEVKGYGIHGKSFFHADYLPEAQSDGKKVFFECLVKSKVSLFVYRDRFFIINAGDELQELIVEERTIQRNGTTYNVEKPLFKSTLQKSMEDCTTIHEKLRNVLLTRTSLVSLFDEYISCTGHPVEKFTRKNGNKVRYGLSLGVLLADFNFKANGDFRYIFADGASFENSISFSPSFLIELPLGNSDRFNISTGLNFYYTKNEFNRENSSAGLKHHFEVEAARIEVPLLVKYSLTHGNVKWSIKAGGGFNGLIKCNTRMVVSSLSDLILSVYSNDIKQSGLLMNAIGGLSVEFLLGNHVLLMEGYYSKSESIFDSEAHGTFNAFKFSVGMFF